MKQEYKSLEIKLIEVVTDIVTMSKPIGDNSGNETEALPFSGSSNFNRYD